MNLPIQMGQWIAVACATALAGVSVYLGYRGLRSRLRPLLIFATSWAVAIRCLWSVPRAILGLGLVIASGAGLQLLSTAFPVFSEETFIIAGVVWQAVMATLVAALAVFLHLFVINDILAERRFGAETHFYRGAAVNKALHPRPPSLPLLVRAAALGLGIWLLSFGLTVASNSYTFFSPRLYPLLSPTLTRLTIFLGTTFTSFLIVTLASLVRPALSFGSSRPVLVGIGLAVKHAPALYLVTALLLIAPAIVGFLSIYIPNQLSPTNMSARIFGAIVFLIFSILQVVVVEVATVLFTNRAMNQSTEKEDANRLPSQFEAQVCSPP